LDRKELEKINELLKIYECFQKFYREEGSCSSANLKIKVSLDFPYPLLVAGFHWDQYRDEHAKITKAAEEHVRSEIAKKMEETKNQLIGLGYEFEDDSSDATQEQEVVEDDSVNPLLRPLWLEKEP